MKGSPAIILVLLAGFLVASVSSSVSLATTVDDSYAVFDVAACPSNGQTVTATLTLSSIASGGTLDFILFDTGNYTIFIGGNAASGMEARLTTNGQTASLILSSFTSNAYVVILSGVSATVTGSATFVCNGPLLTPSSSVPTLPPTIVPVVPTPATTLTSPSASTSTSTVTTTSTIMKTATATTTFSGVLTTTSTVTVPTTTTKTTTQTSTVTSTSFDTVTTDVTVTADATTVDSTVTETITEGTVYTTVTVTPGSGARSLSKNARASSPAAASSSSSSSPSGSHIRHTSSGSSPIPLTAHRPTFNSTSHRRTRSSIALGGCPLINHSVPVTIGSQTFNMMVDTGSGFPAVAGATCSNCNGATPAYSPGSSAIALPAFGSPTFPYGSGSYIASLYFETLTIGTFEVSNIAFGAMTSQTTMLSDETCQLTSSSTPAVQGILGMSIGQVGGYGENSAAVFPSFATALNQYFVLQLCESGGALWINSYDSTTFSSGPNYAPMITTGSNALYYTISAGALSLGATTVNAALGPVIIDSGSTAIILPTATYNSILSQLNSNTVFKAAFPNWAAGIDFNYGQTIAGGYTTYELNAQLPALSIVINGITYTLTPVDSYITQYYTSSGVEYVFGLSSSTTLTILGQGFMNQFITFFDQAAGYVGLAPSTSCQNVWSYSSWSACSGTCGLGSQTRTFTCNNYLGTTVASSSCHTTPISSQSCLLAACTITATATATVTSTSTTTSTSTVDVTSTSTATTTTTSTATATATASATTTVTTVDTVTVTDTTTYTPTVSSTVTVDVPYNVTETVTVTASGSSSGDSGSNIGPGVVAGAVIGSLVGAALIIGATFFVVKKYFRPSPMSQRKDHVEMGI